VNPFYFGDASRRLFGIYHPPKGPSPRSHGVVLCYPFGQEYMRSHRAFRQLANLLSRRGFHVFRFDYHGTGDSDGESTEASVNEWPRDVGRAIDELEGNADIERVSLVGLRLGAAMATLCARGRADIDDLVLWDPVVSGSAYLGEVLADHPDPLEGTVGVLGFPLTEKQRQELEQIDLAATPPSEARPFLVVSDQDERAAVLARAWREEGLEVRIERLPSPGNWNEVDNYGSALMPRDHIQSIIEHLSKDTS
jgi:pimeloyl-ACP methyl ester carboxylesterase